MPHTGAVEKINPVLAALVRLGPKVKPVWVVTTPRHPRADRQQVFAPEPAPQLQHAQGAVHQHPAYAEPERHEQQRGYGQGRELGGGEVEPPEDGGKDQGDLGKYDCPVFGPGHGTGFYARTDPAAVAPDPRSFPASRTAPGFRYH